MMAMRNCYIFEGIDAKVVMDEAHKNTVKGDNVLIHYHKHMETCNDKCHLYAEQKKAT
jgi:hypothetical protein